MEKQMFDPKKWIESAPAIVDTTIDVVGEKVKIRRLTGTQWERYLKASRNIDESTTVTVLHFGLVNEQSSDKRFPIQQIIAFADACPAKADKIAAAILDITMATIGEEEKAIEDAEKNSANPVTPPPSVAGVGTTDRTRPQPTPVGVN
jgi:hypothetical protein